MRPKNECDININFCFFILAHRSAMSADARHKRSYSRILGELRGEIYTDFKRAIPSITDDSGNIEPFALLKTLYMSIAALFIIVGIYFLYREYLWLYHPMSSKNSRKFKTS